MKINASNPRRKHMKKLAFVSGILLIGAILVAAGYWLGFGQRFATEMFSITALDNALTAASSRAMILHELDSGHVDDARSFLRTELDGDILTIWAMGDYSDSRNRKMATNLLNRIASYRAEYPSNYTNRNSGDEAQIDAKIASILEEAKKAGQAMH
jgi:hypothetical protein